MGCLFGSPPIHPSPQQKNQENSVPNNFNPIQDSSSMRNANEYKNNIVELSNRMEQQDHSNQELIMKKPNVAQISQLKEGEYQKLENLGAKITEEYQLLCKYCYQRCERFHSLKKGLQICGKCSGSGVIAIEQVLRRNCSKCRNFLLGISSLNVCQCCNGRGAVLK